jgi:uncharacterized protein (DUF1778 family)
MADLRAKDVDIGLVARVHVAAILTGKKYSQFIVDAVTDAVNETQRKAKRTPKEKTKP